MTALLILICLVFLIVVLVQIGKVSELANRIKGEEDTQNQVNFWQSRLGVVFMVLFLVACIVSAWYYKNYMLGYGPHLSASEGGERIDYIFNITLLLTGIVFFITQILLFWYGYKYRSRKGHKAIFISHDNRLEIIWTLIPALTMTGLVVYGLDVWGDVMADVSPDEDVINVEAVGMQFAWLLRYPGEDGELGATNFRLIDGVNPLGQDWTDEANLDDIQPSEIVLPVGKKVRVKIGARDVLHSFFLPHFRVKMDAIPGIPTYFVFTPSITTEEYRQRLSEYDEYQVPSDPDDPNSPMLWEVFDYELACAELCGNGHFSMRRVVKIVSEEEYKSWLSEQSSYYKENIKGTEADPNRDDSVSETTEPVLQEMTQDTSGTQGVIEPESESSENGESTE